MIKDITVSKVYFSGSVADWCNIDCGYTSARMAIDNLYIGGELATTVDIPEGVTSLKGLAFYTIKCIETVVIPKSLKIIPHNAFKYTTPQAVIYRGTMADWCDISFGYCEWQGYGGWDLYSNPVKSTSLLYIDGERIHHFVVGNGTKTIKSMTFYDAKYLNSITIPKTVTKIQKHCFEGATNLKDIYFDGTEAEWNAISVEAYNAKSDFGAVSVFDANDKLIEVVPIERFKGNMVESIKDTVEKGYKLIDDVVWGDAFTFQQDSYCKKTSIEINVPAGGRIEITNNTLHSESCAVTNYVGFFVETAFAISGAYKTHGSFEAGKDDIMKNIVSTVMKQKELPKKLAKKLTEAYAQKITTHILDTQIVKLEQDGLSILNDGGIDVKQIFTDTLEKFGFSTIEDIFTGFLGSYGFIFKGLFTYSKFVNLTSWFLDMEPNPNHNPIVIYFDKDGKISQPDKTVQVSIPVPSGYDTSKCAVYWLKNDGTIEEVPSEYSNGYMTFLTDHFSYYAVADFRPPIW